MHILIGLLTAIAGLFWAINSLQRSGFNFNALNPFLWFRRKKWQAKYQTKPIHSIQQPMEVAAVLLLAILKCEGEISSEQKSSLKEIFKTEFKLDDNEADDLILACSHMLRDEIYISDQIDKVLKPSAAQFSAEQVSSLIQLMEQTSKLDGKQNKEQDTLIAKTSAYFEQLHKKAGSKWD